jgi:hypothetical protein
MSNLAQGPGWWVASDGNWYPPEQHPSVPRFAPAPQPVAPYVPPPSYAAAEELVVPEAEPARRTHAPGLTPYVADHVVSVLPQSKHDDFVSALPGSAPVTATATRKRAVTNLPSFWDGAASAPADPGDAAQAMNARRISGGGGIPIGAVQTGGAATATMVAMPPPLPADQTGAMSAPEGRGPGGAAGGMPAGGYGTGQAGPLSPYEEGLYSGGALRARQRRKHFPIWTLLIIIIVVVGGGLLYWHVKVTSNPHRTATSIAYAYVSGVQHKEKALLQTYVVPGQKPVLGNEAPLSTQAFTYATASKTVSGHDTDVLVLACANLYAGASCSTTIFGYIEGVIPVQKIDGSWYVDAKNLPTCTQEQDLVCVVP